MGELTALSRPLSCIKGCLLLREERGGEGMVGEGRGRRREGWGGERGEEGRKEWGGKGEYASLALGDGRHCIWRLLVEALPSLVSGRHFVFLLVLFLCVLTNLFIHSFIHSFIHYAKRSRGRENANYSEDNEAQLLQRNRAMLRII